MSTRSELTTLGTGAALPARGRYPTAQFLIMGEEHFLIDCGEGTQERLRQAGINPHRIRHILISHLHGDHYLGLMGLISSMHLNGREKPLAVHGPQELEEIIRLQMRVSQTFLRYPLTFHVVEQRSGASVLATERVTVTALALKHRIPCTGYLFRERPGLRILRKEEVHRIPHYARTAVKEGQDLVLENGEVVPNAVLTTDPPAPRSYAYCSDTAHEPALIPFLKGVDLLYHEATFTEALAKRARETQHSTAAQAATMARDSGVGRLLLGHFSSRYKNADVLLQEALPIFPRTELAYEGGVFPIRPR